MRLRILSVKVFQNYTTMMVEVAGCVQRFQAPTFHQVLKAVHEHYNLA